MDMYQQSNLAPHAYTHTYAIMPLHVYRALSHIHVCGHFFSGDTTEPGEIRLSSRDLELLLQNANLNIEHLDLLDPNLAAQIQTLTQLQQTTPGGNQSFRLEGVLRIIQRFFLISQHKHIV